MSLSLGWRQLMCLFLAITTGVVVHGQTPGPNAVALINGQTMLDCLTIDPTLSNWRRTTDGSSNALVIATGCNVVGNNAAYYRTEQPGGNICRLIIANVTMQQAGVYSCNDGGSILYRSLVTVIDPAARVIVYNMSEVVVGDQLNISCSINYSGPLYPAPSLHPSPYWTTSQGQIYTSTTYNTSTNVVTLVATVTVQKYTVPIFQCKTVFNITGDTNTYNPVPPADNFTVGNTTELDVQYPPENISINSTVSTKDKCVSKPANLICTADANPPAQYSWVDIINKITTPGAVKTITSGGQYQCLASNNIRGQIYTDTKTVNETSCHPVTVDNTTISGSSCANNSCTCGNQSSVMLTCQAYGYPKPAVQWWSVVRDFEDLLNGSIVVTIDGNYNCISSNVFGGTTHNATVSIVVSNCLSPPTTLSTTPLSTTNDAFRCGEVTTTSCTSSDSCDVANAAAIALGVILFVSLAMNIIQLIFLIRNVIDKHDPYQRAGTIVQPEILDRSNGTPAAATYEELTRPTEFDLLPITYEKLTPKPPVYINHLS